MVDVGGLLLVETGYDTSLSLLDADSIIRWLEKKWYLELGFPKCGICNGGNYKE